MLYAGTSWTMTNKKLLNWDRLQFNTSSTCRQFFISSNTLNITHLSFSIRDDWGNHNIYNPFWNLKILWNSKLRYWLVATSRFDISITDIFTMLPLLHSYMFWFFAFVHLTCQGKKWSHNPSSSWQEDQKMNNNLKKCFWIRKISVDNVFNVRRIPWYSSHLNMNYFES